MPCTICSLDKPEGDLIPASLVREGVAKLIRMEHPDFSEDSLICREDLRRYRERYVARLLEFDKGKLDALEREVVASIAAQEVASENLNGRFGERLTAGQRSAARGASSWAS